MLNTPWPLSTLDGFRDILRGFRVFKRRIEVRREINLNAAIALLRPDERGGDRAREHHRHDPQRDANRNVYADGDDKHLHANEGEHDSQTRLEVAELFDHAREQKEERAQA